MGKVNNIGLTTLERGRNRGHQIEAYDYHWTVSAIMGEVL